MAECAVCANPLPAEPVQRWFCSDDCLGNYLVVRELIRRANRRHGADQGPAQITQSAVCDGGSRES